METMNELAEKAARVLGRMMMVKELAKAQCIYIGQSQYTEIYKTIAQNLFPWIELAEKPEEAELVVQPVEEADLHGRCKIGSTKEDLAKVDVLFCFMEGLEPSLDDGQGTGAKYVVSEYVIIECKRRSRDRLS